VHDRNLPVPRKTAEEWALDAAKAENFPYVIWWIMNRGYIPLPKGERPSWLFSVEVKEILP